MQLVSARVQYYRSAEDSEEFTVEPDVTCLVGKNESGKTNVLQGLYRVNPVQASAGFDEIVDFPAWLTRKRREFPDGQKIPAVCATFRFDASEIEVIEGDLGPGALTGPEFTVTVGYRGGQSYSLPYDEAAVVRGLCSGLDLPASAAKSVTAKTTVSELLQALDSLPEAPPTHRLWRNASAPGATRASGVTCSTATPRRSCRSSSTSTITTSCPARCRSPTSSPGGTATPSRVASRRC